ncbi:MAG: hypothetical protein KF771_06390 [Burkholderiales bacterium]|nr:hypothetical protein [Burkholderiales bacterium]
MALVACPGCAKEFSAEAATCPHCGHPVSGSPSTITTQASGREWKIVRLIGGLLMVTGLVAWAGNSTDAGMVFFLGCLIYLGGRLGAWWMQRT